MPGYFTSLSIGSPVPPQATSDSQEPDTEELSTARSSGWVAQQDL